MGNGGCCSNSDSSSESSSSGCCSTGSDSSSESSSSGCCSTGEAATTLPPSAIAEFAADETHPVHFTDKAVEAVKNAIKEEGQAGDALRVSVVGGGCSGYQYNLDFDKESRMGDITLQYDGVTIFVDPVSAGYLKGTVIDFVSGLNGTGFKFNNPNAKRTCGCGSSFS